MGLISSIVTLALFALLAWFYFRRKARQTPLPEGTVVYEDAGKVQVSQTLVSQQYGLSGRPDYLIKTVDGLAPIEIKSRNCSPRGPYDGEEAQLLAYCVLVDHNHAARCRGCGFRAAEVCRQALT